MHQAIECTHCHHHYIKPCHGKNATCGNLHAIGQAGKAVKAKAAKPAPAPKPKKK